MDESDASKTEHEEYSQKNKFPKKALSAEQRLERCKERNRLHSRKTREKKKVLQETMRLRLDDLSVEKVSLCNQLVDSTVADILVGMSSNLESGIKKCSVTSQLQQDTMNLVDLRENVFNELTDSAEDEVITPPAWKDMTTLSTVDSDELERLRRERNRIHARHCRKQKKLMMSKMVENITKLEEEVRYLRESMKNKAPQPSLNTNGPHYVFSAPMMQNLHQYPMPMTMASDGGSTSYNLISTTPMNYNMLSVPHSQIIFGNSSNGQTIQMNLRNPMQVPIQVNGVPLSIPPYYPQPFPYMQFQPIPLQSSEENLKLPSIQTQFGQKYDPCFQYTLEKQDLSPTNLNKRTYTKQSQRIPLMTNINNDSPEGEDQDISSTHASRRGSYKQYCLERQRLRRPSLSLAIRTTDLESEIDNVTDNSSVSSSNIYTSSSASSLEQYPGQDELEITV